MDEFLTYRKFNSPEELEDLKTLFEKNNIQYIIDDTSIAVDLTFSGGNNLNKEIRIKIKQSDFILADKLLEEQAENLYCGIDKDHYLLEFTNEELLEIIEKPDEWSNPDIIAAQKLLNERGINITKEKIDYLKNERLAELSKPEKGQTGWIIVGYITAFLGGFLGVFIGWHLLSFKKTLPDGQRVYSYDVITRKHGRKILITGIICLVFWLCYKLVLMMN